MTLKKAVIAAFAAAGLAFVCFCGLFGVCGRGRGVTYELSQSETVETVFFKLKINSAMESFKEGEFVPKNDFHRFILIDVEIENTFDEKGFITMSYSDFKLAWNNGGVYPEKYFEVGQLPNEYTLEEGQKISGRLVFVVPTGAEGMRLTYDETWSDGFKGNSYAVRIDELEQSGVAPDLY